MHNDPQSTGSAQKHACAQCQLASARDQLQLIAYNCKGFVPDEGCPFGQSDQLCSRRDPVGVPAGENEGNIIFFHEYGRRVGMVPRSSLKEGKNSQMVEKRTKTPKPNQNQTLQAHRPSLDHLVVFPLC